jgi:hypothetical protein
MKTMLKWGEESSLLILVICLLFLSAIVICSFFIFDTLNIQTYSYYFFLVFPLNQNEIV